MAILILFLLPFQGMNLLELAAHLEEKAAQLRHEGLGRIKIALAGMDTYSLLEILEGHLVTCIWILLSLLFLLRSLKRK